MKHVHHYQPDVVQKHPRGERRVLDVDCSPKRRDGDKPREIRVRNFSAREEELLALIDGHIARIGAGRLAVRTAPSAFNHPFWDAQ